MTAPALALRRLAVAVLFFAASAVALAFLVLPLVALLTDRPPGDLFDQLSNPVVTDALLVSLETSAAAQALILLFGTPLAYLLATRRFRGRSLVVNLPGSPKAVRECLAILAPAIRECLKHLRE